MFCEPKCNILNKKSFLTIQQGSIRLPRCLSTQEGAKQADLDTVDADKVLEEGTTEEKAKETTAKQRIKEQN